MKKLIFLFSLVVCAAVTQAQMINGRYYNPLGNYNQHRGLTTDSNMNLPRVIPQYGFRKGAIMADTVLNIIKMFNGDSWDYQKGIDSFWIVDGGLDADTLRYRSLGATYTAGLIAGGSGSGSVTDFTAGNLSPLFTSNVASSTTTPALTFSLSNTDQYKVFGRSASGSGAPSYVDLDTSFIPNFYQKVRGLFSFSNGLNATNGTVNLGGQLTLATALWGNPFKYSYALSGTDSIVVQTNYAGSFRVDKYSTGTANNLIIGNNMYFELNDGTSQSAGFEFLKSGMLTRFQDSRTVKTGLEYTSLDTTGYTAYTLVPKNYINQRLAAFTPSGGNLINGGNNLGSGSQVFKDTSSNKLNFRSIVAGTGISVTQNTNDITIAATNIDSSAARVRTGTYAQRTAIASPVIGDVFTQTDRLKGLYFYDGDGWQFQGNPLQYIYQNTFNGNTTLNAGYNTTQGAVTSGTGASVPINLSSGTDGYLNCQTGTTSGGYANTNFLGGNALTNMVYDSVIVYTEYKVLVPILSDGTDRFQIAVGGTTSTSSYNFPAFVFYYSDNNNSGQWSTITRAHNSGSLTIKNTSVAVTAGTWVKLAVEIDGYAKTIKFYINDVLVQTHTSSDNIPLNGAITWGVNSGYGHAGIIKTVGTNSRSLYVDYVFAYLTKRKY
jgi:hypothetical protein